MDISATFCSAVNQWFERVLVIHVNHIHQRRVDPPSCFDAVETADNKLKLHVEVLVEFLYSAIVWCNLDALDALLDEFRGDFCFELSYIVFAKEELAVEVRDVDGIWSMYTLVSL